MHMKSCGSYSDRWHVNKYHDYLASACCREASGTSRPHTDFGDAPPPPPPLPRSLGGAADRCLGGDPPVGGGSYNGAKKCEKLASWNPFLVPPLYLDREETNHRGAKMQPTVLQGYICALRRGRKGPVFYWRKQHEHQHDRHPHDGTVMSACSGGKSIGSRLLSREIHRVGSRLPRRACSSVFCATFGQGRNVRASIAYTATHDITHITPALRLTHQHRPCSRKNVSLLLVSWNEKDNVVL